MNVDFLRLRIDWSFIVFASVSLISLGEPN